MKINRVADEKIAPSWAFDLNTDDFAHFSETDSERLQNTPINLDDEALVAQRDVIEKCARDGGYYFYNSGWDAKRVEDLKEYAMACGMNLSKFKETHPEYIEDIKVVSAEALTAKMSKQAASEGSIKLSDPFHLENIEDSRLTDPNRDDWEKVTPQKNLGRRPSDVLSSIKPLRGGENYLDNSYTQTARGRNTIGNPDAIQQYAEETEDTGERLRKENEERLNARQKNHEVWEQEKVASQEHEDTLRGTVFPTEVMNAHTGLRSDFDLTKQNLPEQTDGEKLASSQEMRRKSIQRETVDNDWEVMKTASIRRVSDDLTESLKKALGKK